ncbi:MAG TPA: type II secretion system protein [Gemmatimonadales bacterium]|nr:type II secretion system protein [Gemmatimonadales bacterium]
MEDRLTTGQLPPDRSRLGFTMVELVLTITIIGILAGIMIPAIGRTMQATRVKRAAAIVAADLENAFTLAGRFRRPMRISCTCGSGIYTVADLAGGTVRLRRTLVGDSDLSNMTLTFGTPTVDIYPSGVSSAALQVTISSGSSSRVITASTAGFVRITP